MRAILLTLFSGSLLFISCQKKEAEIPSYLYIEPFTFTASDAEGGSTSSITNGQVFIGNQFVGDYEFPMRIPVVASGDVEVSVYPSVKLNGISNGRKVYKLYEPHIEKVNLVKGKIDSIKPASTYKSNVNFQWVEDFDDNAISMSKGNKNSLVDSLMTYPFNHFYANKFSGKGFSAGVIFPTNSFGFTWEAVTNEQFNVPKKGKDVYVELDLLADVNVTVGIVYIIGTTITQREVATFFPTDGEYKKLYINLEPETRPLPDETSIKLFIGGANFLDSSAIPKIFIDNLKLAYLQ